MGEKANRDCFDIATWFMITGKDLFCFPMYIASERKIWKSLRHDICWGMYQKNVFLHLENKILSPRESLQHYSASTMYCFITTCFTFIKYLQHLKIWVLHHGSFNYPPINCAALMTNWENIQQIRNKALKKVTSCSDIILFIKKKTHKK